MPLPARLAVFVGYWPTIIAILGSVGLGGMLKTWLDYLRRSKDGDSASALSLIEQQRLALDHANKRIDRLERAAARKDELHELRLGQLRHRLNNMRMIFEVTIRLMKTSSSDRMPEIVSMIEEMRAAHEKEEAAETAAIASAIASGAAEMLADAPKEGE